MTEHKKEKQNFKLITKPKALMQVAVMRWLFKLQIMYNLSINPEKWVDLGELELKTNKPYWFKK